MSAYSEGAYEVVESSSGTRHVEVGGSTLCGRSVPDDWRRHEGLSVTSSASNPSRADSWCETCWESRWTLLD